MGLRILLRVAIAIVIGLGVVGIATGEVLNGRDDSSLRIMIDDPPVGAVCFRRHVPTCGSSP